MRCPECYGLNGVHGLVHKRHAAGGGGSNLPCSRADVQLPGQLTLGDALREAGQATALAAVTPWPELALAWVRQLPTGHTFTSEDLTAAVGLPRGDVGTNRNNAVGAVMAAVSRQHLAHRVAYVKAARPESHGAVLALWERC